MKPFFSFLLLVPVFLCASAALNGGVKGTGALQSAYPLPENSIEGSIATQSYFGNALGLSFNNNEISDASRFDFVAAANYGVLPYLELGLRLPFHQDNFAGESYNGIGDLRTTFKLNYPTYPHKQGFSLSYLLQIDLPTGSDQNEGGFSRSATNQSTLNDTTLYIYVDSISISDQGDTTRHKKWANEEQWTELQRKQDSIPGADSIPATDTLNRYHDPDWSPYSARSPVYILKLLMSADFNKFYKPLPLLVHLNFGLALSEQKRENAFLFAGGAEYWIQNQYGIFWAFDVQANVSHSSTSIPWFDYPVQNLIGLEYPLHKHNVTFSGGASFSINHNKKYEYTWRGKNATPLTDAFHTYQQVPTWGLFLEVSSNISLSPKDSDEDGIQDHKDKCPLIPEDIDGYLDTDGCIDADNDKDGIPDADDKCPLQMGTKENKGCSNLKNKK